MTHRAIERPRSSWRRAMRLARLAAVTALAGTGGLLVLAVVNWGYHVARKPAELAVLIPLTAPKTPRATWEAYGPSFRSHATEIVPAELLAALAHAESLGDPLARPPWRFRWSLNPFDVYRPASSAAGLLQITDATFQEARELCIRERTVARRGAWHDLSACWFNALYSRLIPDHAIEMTAAHLHRTVVDTLARPGVRRASKPQQRDLAAVAHLCGVSRAATFAGRGFRLSGGDRCGAHRPQHYLEHVRGLYGTFVRLRGPEA